MKAKIIVLMVTLFLFFPSQAQSKFEFGVRFVPQASTFRYKLGIPGLNSIFEYLKITSPYYFRIRPANGVGFLYNPFLRLRFGADLLYSMQGGGYKERKTNLNYLVLPIWLGINSKSKRRIILTLQSGIQFSFLIRATNKYSDGTSVDIRKDVKNTSWGVPVALGIRFKVCKTYLVSTQLYWYSDLYSIARTNSDFGVYNYIYPGLRISVDQNFFIIKGKIKTL